MTAARDRYLRLVLALALAGAVVDEVDDRPWLGMFPSGGLVLAGAAALLAAASGRHGVAGPAVRAALLRLLAPFWAFAAVAVPVMTSLGPLSWDHAWLWLLPVSDPPVTAAALPWAGWVRLVPAWLWLLLLSPGLLWLARRWPLRLMALPLVVLSPISVGLVTVTGPAHEVLVELCVFGCCWVLGVLYADGRLTRVPLAVALAAGVGAAAAGLWVASVQREQYAARDLSEIPLAALLLGAGVVLLLLRIQPAVGGLGRLPRLHAVLRFLTDRPVTALLWAGPAGTVAPLVLDLVGVDRRFEPLGVGLLLLAVVVALGWAERPWVLPWRRRRYVFQGNLAGQPVVEGRA